MRNTKIKIINNIYITGKKGLATMKKEKKKKGKQVLCEEESKPQLTSYRG